jgi:hypothetical protein
VAGEVKIYIMEINVQNAGLSKSDIVSIGTASIIFILGLLDKYFGWGGMGIFILIILAVAFLVFARNTKLYPYLLLIIGVAIGLGLNWSGNTIEKLSPLTSLESKGLTVSTYSKENDVNAGFSSVNLSANFSVEGTTQYWLDYDFPSPEKPSYAVLEFKFPRSQDLTMYKYVEFTIDFVAPDNQIGFYFENINESGKGDNKILSKNFHLENATITLVKGEEYSFRIPLDAFADTNMANVSEFGIYAHTYFSTGKGKVMIGNITFSEN